MPLYAYQAIDKTGNLLEGRLTAENPQAAADRLSQMGYAPVEIKEIKDSPLRGSLLKRNKVKLGELAFFSRQLAAMLASGIPLTRCLYTLSEQTGNAWLARCTGEIARRVEGGMSFSEALGGYPDIFSGMYREMIKAGELGGALNEILQRLSQQLEKEKYLRDSIRSATFYPSVVIVFAAIIVLAMMFWVVPIFVGFFPQQAALPLPTRLVVGFSNSLRQFWYFYLLGLAAVMGGLRLYIGSPAGSRAWDKIKFRLPVFGDLFKKATLARFCRTLATLLGGGIPVLQALAAAGPAAGSSQVAEAVKQVAAGIQEGRSIAAPLKKSGFFPPMVINMVAVGEETGQLAALLGRVADFYEEEVATVTKGLTALIEPLLLIFVGFIIGAIVIAIYLPIFTVVTSVGR
ncbi:type II secretion system F family protein [Desulforamulus hydrothermalis]|uniref:Type II secretion system protein n=1 Tax=Desulforamulus hydrothermalis Lam5 = DSM 18033 TaxID=1121428 RepID=K8E0D2_9FIRM|nr:type II secretion system F family protein [Desulforamulus hydrothermalis]CCO08880.1 Type II secretion system protein [Desulforamulus hydrothermalis Lam5 = DSM 18033]SHG73876.1 type IV pilus assembly protein PilC [Desulforamulus hydrothermalis Lam5 = DSM 18033]